MSVPSPFGQLRSIALAVIVCQSVACSDDSGGSECDAPGEPAPCQCGSRAGTRICLPDGSFSQCNCLTTRSVPCAVPGQVFRCACEGGSQGVEICLADGDYTPCDCGPAAGEMQADSATPRVDLDAGEPPGMAMGCPAGFACVQQMGLQGCVDPSTGVPPLCTSSEDCVAAGLPAAECVDPMIGGVLVCAQFCN